MSANTSVHALQQDGSNGAVLHATAQLSSLLNPLQAIEFFTAAASVFECCTIPHAIDATRLLTLTWDDATACMPGITQQAPSSKFTRVLNPQPV